MPRALLEWLRDLGYDVSDVHDEALTGHPDAAVAAAANREQRLLVTLDRGFGDVRHYPPGSHPGIVILRPSSQGRAGVMALMAELLASHDLIELTGAIAVIEPARVRVRRPEA